MRTVPRIPAGLSVQRVLYGASKQSASSRTYRVSCLNFPLRQHRNTSLAHLHSTVRSSSSPYIFLGLLVCGGAVAYEFLIRGIELEEVGPADTPVIETLSTSFDSRAPVYAEMSIPEGCLGNLTPLQEAKLREFWILTLKTFGVTDPEKPNGTSDESANATPVEVQIETPEKKKKKRSSFFSRGRHDDASDASTAADDKYGQTAELQQILKTQSPETLRSTFWDMSKNEHPDATLLRFLRARKWDIDRALAMMVSTMDWRKNQMKVEEEIVAGGESSALAESESSDATVKKDGHDFLAQIRMGKSFLHGADRNGRPVTYVRARLHRGGEQSEKSMEKYTVYVIETARLTLNPPVETGCIVFDMTGFTLANMDYAPVKFMIKVFEANYPESLGAVLVHKAPWVFQGIWKVIRGWLDPVVAAKVHFTNDVNEMDHFIPKSQLIKELGGNEDWEYKYIEAVEGENDVMKDTATKDKLIESRNELGRAYEKETFKWIHAGAADANDEVRKIKAERDSLANKLLANYWQLDPYIRARTLYDRVGMIQKDGKIDFYPQHTLKADNVNGTAIESSGPPKSSDLHPDDDVD